MPTLALTVSLTGFWEGVVVGIAGTFAAFVVLAVAVNKRGG